MDGVLADRWLMWCRSRAQSLSVSSKTVSITGAQLSKYCWRDEDPAEGSVLLWLLMETITWRRVSGELVVVSWEVCPIVNLVNLWLPLRETAYCVGSSLDLWYSSLLSLHSQDVVCNLWCLPYYQLPTPLGHYLLTDQCKDQQKNNDLDWGDRLGANLYLSLVSFMGA